MKRPIDKLVRQLGCLLTALALGPLAGAATPQEAQQAREARTKAEARSLEAQVRGAAVSIHRATGAASFVRVAPGSGAGLADGAGAPDVLAQRFFATRGGLFGIADAAAELRLMDSRTDELGITRLSYQQVYRGVPVFAGVLRAHFDPSGELVAVNGTFVPDINVGTVPLARAERVAQTAIQHASVIDPEKPAQSAGRVAVVSSNLVVFRAGLVKGEPGPNHLAYRVEVSNGGDIHSDVFVDAVSGKYLDAYSRAMDALNRRAFDGAGSVTEPGPNYPGTPFWVEGQVPFPTGNTEADNMILASAETYNLYENAFAYDSGGLYPFFPATSGQMHSIFNRGWGCVNASWNSTYISFCPGTTTDDVTSHEWSHAYTEFTSGLIYAWQSGAMNESYSDIYGELVDLINGRGLDTPGPARLAAQCSTLGGTPQPTFVVNSPPSVAGSKVNKGAGWNSSGVSITANLQLVNDGAGASTSDGCEAFSLTAGAIALLDRGNCTFQIKVDNAAAAGASMVLVANNVAGVITMGGTGTIPGTMIQQSDGTALKTALLGGPVNATFVIGPSTDPSLRWLIGEEASAFGGAIRDMWNPTCFANPDRVGDAANYVCSTADAGGVHSNSGVPNHLYALLSDGGSFNGQSVPALGLTKATHLFFRAQSQYLGPASDFSDLADALEQSCVDLTGVNLQTLSTGAPGGPSGQIISAADCLGLAKGIAAVELRVPPTFCNFVPLLNVAPPALCAAGQVPSTFFSQSFESDPFSAGWAATTGPVSPDFTPRAWVWDNNLPTRAGSGVFAVDFQGGTCLPGGDESGVIQLESPTFVVPSSSARVSFDHWVAAELNYDGGNLKISVNGGAFTLVPSANITYNPYPVASLQATNPLAGQAGYSGADGGSNSGSWGSSVVDLTGLASAGQSVKLRWDFGTDGCAGVVGWYLDNVAAYACQAAGGGSPTISIADAGVVEGDSGTINALFNVSLSPADGTGPHAVQFVAANGLAVSGADYYPAGGTVVFAAGETSKAVSVAVVGDTVPEPNETFTVTLSNATGTIGDGSGQGNIYDDDFAPAGTFAKGDFNSDGLPDLVFRQVSNGAHNKVWFMDGVTRTSEADITPDAANASWLVRGVDDFDSVASPGSGGDDKNDLVFWNQSTGNVEFWLMNGTNRPGATVPLTGGAVLPTNWDLSATADFNADGKPDLVWRNFTSQKIVIWKMGEGAVPGTQKTGNITPTPDQAVDPNWLIVAAADYSGDGNTDFLWYNYSSGRIVTWYMNASVVRTSGQFTTPNAAGDFNWKVVAGSDYSRTYVPGTPPLNSPDIVWRNETSGNQVVWHLDFNSTRVHGQFTNPTANTPALDWVIVGPR